MLAHLKMKTTTTTTMEAPALNYYNTNDASCKKTRQGQQKYQKPNTSTSWTCHLVLTSRLVVFKLQRSDDFNFRISEADRNGGLKTPEMGSLVSTDTMDQWSITITACLYLGHLKSWIAALCGYVQTQFDEMAVEQFWYILTYWTALLRQHNGH